jgi:hypothetical protein
MEPQLPADVEHNGRIGSDQILQPTVESLIANQVLQQIADSKH